MAYPRFDTDLPAHFRYGGSRVEGRLENASLGGLFLQTSTIPRRGERLTLRLQGPDGEPLELQGIVWWTTLDSGPAAGLRQGFGLRLTDCDGRYRKLLHAIAGRSA